MCKDLDKWLRGFSYERLLELSDVLDGELERRSERKFDRGQVRSTYMSDGVRGERMARRESRAA